MSTWTWIADAVLAALLLGTLVMALRLDRALRIVRRDRGAFEELISSLSAATGAVKQGVQKLRHEAELSAEKIERRSAEADRMATDLSFLIERAERVSAKLETQIPAPAPAPRPKAAPSRSPAKAPVKAAARTAEAGRSQGTRRRTRTVVAPAKPSRTKLASTRLR